MAIKRLLDPAQAARFEIEGRLLARLSHTRVVERDRAPRRARRAQFLVMDLIEGRDLDAVLKEAGGRGCRWTRCSSTPSQAAEALEYVHAAADGAPRRQAAQPRPGRRRARAGGLRGRARGGAGRGRHPRPGHAAVHGARGAGGRGGLAAQRRLRPGRHGLGAAGGQAAGLRGPHPPGERSRARPRDRAPLRRCARSAPSAGWPRWRRWPTGWGSRCPAPRAGRWRSACRGPTARSELLEAIVRTAAGVFDAAAASIALTESRPASWSTNRPGARGPTRSWACACRRGGALPARWWTAARAWPSPTAATTRGSRPTWPAGRLRAPHHALVPLKQAGQAIGVLSILDRRDGGGYRPADVERADAVRRPGGDRARRE